MQSTGKSITLAEKYTLKSDEPEKILALGGSVHIFSRESMDTRSRIIPANFTGIG